MSVYISFDFNHCPQFVYIVVKMIISMIKCFAYFQYNQGVRNMLLGAAVSYFYMDRGMTFSIHLVVSHPKLEWQLCIIFFTHTTSGYVRGYEIRPSLYTNFTGFSSFNQGFLVVQLRSALRKVTTYMLCQSRSSPPFLLVLDFNNMIGATSGVGTTQPSKTLEFTLFLCSVQWIIVCLLWSLSFFDLRLFQIWYFPSFHCHNESCYSQYLEGVLAH